MFTTLLKTEYQPIIGRFTQRDTHWNTVNIIYGDEVKTKEYEDYLGLNTYTVKLVDYAAVRQSGNVYGYCLNNPLVFIDPNGEVLFTVIGIGVAALFTVVLTGCSAQDSNAWLEQNQAAKSTPLLNFTSTTYNHMQDPSRYVPVTVLYQAITNGVSLSDPQGSGNKMMYYDVITRNGKQYNLEVLYDESTNTVYHFKYTENAIGPLEKVNNK